MPSDAAELPSRVAPDCSPDTPSATRAAPAAASRPGAQPAAWAASRCRPAQKAGAAPEPDTMRPARRASRCMTRPGRQRRRAVADLVALVTSGLTEPAKVAAPAANRVAPAFSWAAPS